MVQQRNFNGEVRRIVGEHGGIHQCAGLIVEQQLVGGQNLGCAQLLFLVCLRNAGCHLIQLLLRTGDLDGRRCADKGIIVQRAALGKGDIGNGRCDIKGVGVHLIECHIDCGGRNGLHAELHVIRAADGDGELFRACCRDVLHRCRCHQIPGIQITHLCTVALQLYADFIHIKADDTQPVFLRRRSGNVHFQRNVVHGTRCGRINGDGDDKPKHNGDHHRRDHHGRTAGIKALQQRLVSLIWIVRLLFPMTIPKMRQLFVHDPSPFVSCAA